MWGRAARCFEGIPSQLPHKRTLVNKANGQLSALHRIAGCIEQHVEKHLDRMANKYAGLFSKQAASYAQFRPSYPEAC